jgi:hypothetical protein
MWPKGLRNEVWRPEALLTLDVGRAILDIEFSCQWPGQSSEQDIDVSFESTHGENYCSSIFFQLSKRP